MSIRLFKAGGITALLICMMCLSLACSQPPAEEKEQKARGVDYDQLWIDQDTKDIAIPENIGGSAELTRNFYFILDGSGSMLEPTDNNCGGDQKFADKIQGARWAVKRFLEHVPNDVNIGLYVFDSQGKREVVPLGSENRDAFVRAVDDIRAGGGTPLAEAILFATKRLMEQYQKQLGYGEFRMVVVTDGIANDIPRAALLAAQYGIPIYTIGLCVGPNHPLRRFSVSYRAADNYNDLSEGLKDTLAELPNYSVTEFEEQ